MSALALDILQSYAVAYPRTVRPLPHGPIAALNVASKHRPVWLKNPRGWFNDPTVDVMTSVGIASFQTNLLKWADSAVAEITRVGAFGGILWNIEGEELDASYIGDPSAAELIAPELNGVLDAFVGKLQWGVFRIGFTLRAQVFDPVAHTQTNSTDPHAILHGKIDYCVNRWGASIFYVDSSPVVPAQVYHDLAAEFPGILLIPEWKDVRHYSCAVPYEDPRNGSWGPTARTLAIYPGAIGCVRVDDQIVQQNPQKVKDAIAAGNIMVWPGHYPNETGRALEKIYAGLPWP